MVDVRVVSFSVQNPGLTSQVALHPFLAASTLHLNTDAPFVIVWHLDGAPAGGAILHGTCRHLDGQEASDLQLLVSAEQGARRTARRLDCREGTPIDWSLAFSNDGGPFSLHLEASTAQLGATCNIALEFGPAQYTPIIVESAAPKLFRLVDGERNLISCNQGGLINRLAPLMSLVDIGRKEGRSVLTWWGPNEHCAANLDDILDVPEVIDPFLGESFEVWSTYGGAVAPLDLSSGGCDKLVHATHPVTTQSPRHDGDYEAATRALKTFRLSKPVQEKLDRYSSADFSRTIGFHIRRPFPNGAFEQLETSKFVLGADVFANFIDALRSECSDCDRILLCTNDLALEALMRKIYGSYVSTHEKESIDNTRDAVAVQDAMVDVQLLARCPVIISQKTSAFAHFAHAMNGSKFFTINNETDVDTFMMSEFVKGFPTGSFTLPRSGGPEFAAWAGRVMNVSEPSQSVAPLGLPPDM